MMLLGESALRSLLLGLLVWAALKLIRVRDTRTETLIWTLVLAAALTMPVLSQLLPQLRIALPHPLAGPASGAPQAGPTPGASGLLSHRGTLLWFVYGLGLSACLARLGLGLVLTFRLYRRADPIRAEWVRGRSIRCSSELKSPASLSHTILLPADYRSWSAAKRDAVLAHEAAHIARRDFFVQLAACVHRAVFWFSPFAWWLQAKLAEIAESASDEAAVEQLNDPLMYAEILVDVARCAQGAPPLVAMAKSALIRQRIDRILCGSGQRSLGPLPQTLVLMGLTLMTLAMAAATTAVQADPAAAPTPHIQSPAVRTRPSATPHPAARHQAAHPRHAAAPVTLVTVSADHNPVSYDPRALLTPAYVAPRDYAPASTIYHAGRTFYIRSTERPVADVTVGDGK